MIQKWSDKMREKNPSMEFANKTALAYSAVCKPLCQELGLPQTAFDILLFLANNPTYKTASDIVEVRHIKANLVSVNVDKLVHEGLLTRCQMPKANRISIPSTAMPSASCFW
jgi:DNA-binding MarR family transcriptional regulator